MKNRAKWNNINGFSLMEMMVTVVVIVVLSALAMIPISKMQKDIRQTELDSRAEMIFTAVQNRMTRLQAAGQSDVYTSGQDVKQMDAPPSDADETEEQRTLVYVTSASKSDEDSAASWLYPETEAEAELWNANWVVEYDAKGGSVYAVFYSKAPMCAPDKFNDLRFRNDRLARGAVVGYYGGDSVGAAETNNLTLTVEDINKDRLAVRAVCKAVGTNQLKFFATVKDESGNIAEFGITKDNGIDTVEQKGRTFTVTLVLDDLSEGKNLRFGQQDRFKNNGLIPGENLTVTIRAKADNTSLIEDAIGTVTVNSLFAEVRENGADRTAVIKYGRHLQNLEEASGLNRGTDRNTPAITAAVQERDISFGASSSWAHEYDDRKFTPIENAQLKSYDSTKGTDHPVIYDLTVDTNGDAGLFKTFGGEGFTGELKNIRLVDAQITGKQTVSTGAKRDGNVGGLVGKLNGTTTIDGCQVYLKNVKGGIAKEDIFTNHTRIGGKVVGGLVGSTEGNPLTIQNSLAATVIQGQTAAGGLIGNGGGNVSVKGSYADCYLSSDMTSGKTGGLIGASADSAGVMTNPITLENCYAAGFLDGSSTAGFSTGNLSAVNYCYSACAPLTKDTLSYGTAANANNNPENDNANKVYYLSETDHPATNIGTSMDYQKLSAADPVELLSDAFTKQNGDTHAYNLMSGLGLSQYSYPRLKELPHYGDWQAKFEDNALVYYERYNDDSYGFFGANISALSDKPVKGDGYGMIYETEPTAKTVTVGGQEYPLPDTAVTIQVTDKGETKTYYLLPLPKELVQDVKTVPEGFYTKLTAGGKDYYYNPHFASTAVTDGSKAPTQISIRTARQLYALSEYYDTYREILPKETVFRQECDIDYAAYDWAKYGKDGKPVKEQKPIGRTETAPFKHGYDGGEHIITRADAGGLSFVSEVGAESSAAVGLFGFVTGTLENIVVTTDQALKTAPTARLGGSVQRRMVYIGVLAGKNSGTIRNCAVSGYKLSCYAYSGSTCYIGGLAGYNEGTVSACGAAIPGISGNTTNARGYYAGALAGVNAGGGYIRQSYALGSIELREIRGSAVISGFVGDNQGTIRNSYCATALSAVTGAEVNGFASAHGSVSDCYYLSGGTYTFAGTVRLYDYELDTNGAQPQDHEQMKNLALVGFAAVDEAKHSINHQNTDPSETVYPYPGSVSGLGRIVHYGDWPTPADMGTVGMIYWEYEEGGANSGYHFSYIGFDAKGDPKEGGSLCTAHDDGGRITDFGYGCYRKKTSPEDTEKVMPSPSDTFKREGERTDVADALAKQVTGYNFTCYQTGEAGLRLESSIDANGTWTLTQGTQTYEYAVCPFFGDSFCPVGDVGKDARNLGKTGAKKQYQIRSVEQLQFINWSYFNGTGSVDRKVTAATYKNFPYLQYATVTGTGTQTEADALEKRPKRSWVQTHDLNGVDMGNPTNGAQNTVFHPIAGAVENRKQSGHVYNPAYYSVTLYAWFGGQYDGGNYYIKNIAIDSYCYNVGLFGTTAGADIRNIVLYSDNGGVIQRSTDYTPTNNGNWKEKQYQCAYVLGGLVGIAYDYQDKLGTSTIENCAIAGYSVRDNSKNKQALGEANVGGLIGVSNVNLNRCSAVVDIQINCTHRDNDENGALNAPMYGTFVRVGGMAGGVRYQVKNCYSGGTITVGKETLRERSGSSSGALLDADTLQFTNWRDTAFKMKSGDTFYPATYIFIGGIGGSGFSSNFTNFTGKESSSDGKPNYENCYTYMTFPKMEGAINGISLIGSVADRHAYAEKMTITNCYYLEGSADIDFSNALKTRGNDAANSLADVYGDGTPNAERKTARERMLQGNLRDMRSVMWGKENNNIYTIDLKKLTYAQMSNRSDKTADNFQTKLGDAFFGWVTNEENGSTIHGKYSFPGDNTALQGQDYPFPTVLTQTNSLGKEVNLHYGAWPKVGMFWSEGIVSMDLIADYNKDVPYKSAIKLELNLTNVSNKDGLTGVPTFTYSDEGVVKASAVRITEGVHKDDFTVTLTGVKTGATEVTAEYNGYTARLMVTVTDVLTVQRLDPITLTLKAPDTQPTEPTPPTGGSEGGGTPEGGAGGTTPGGAGDPAGEDPSTEGPAETTPPTSGEGGETTPEPPAPPTYGPSEPATVTLKLVGRKGNPINAGKSNTKWVIDDSEIVEWETNADGTVKVNDDGSFTLTGIKPGTAELSVTATYTLDGKKYKAKGSLSVTVNEPKPPTTPPETGGGEGGGKTG